MAGILLAGLYMFLKDNNDWIGWAEWTRTMLKTDRSERKRLNIIS
jgi:hypothetical protein